MKVNLVKVVCEFIIVVLEDDVCMVAGCVFDGELLDLGSLVVGL